MDRSILIKIKLARACMSIFTIPYLIYLANFIFFENCKLGKLFFTYIWKFFTDCICKKCFFYICNT